MATSLWPHSIRFALISAEQLGLDSYVLPTLQLLSIVKRITFVLRFYSALRVSLGMKLFNVVVVK